MTTMIRKQVYLESRQDASIKKLAEEAHVTEAEIIRRAVDLLLAEAQRQRRAQAAWEEALALMESRAAQSHQGAAARSWTRADLYAERLERHGTA